MFSRVSVILFTGGAYMAGGMHGGGMRGACMAEGGMHGRQVCVAGGIHGRGHAWHGVCVAGGPA